MLADLFKKPSYQKLDRALKIGEKFPLDAGLCLIKITNPLS
jgi:hypothetical protein